MLETLQSYQKYITDLCNTFLPTIQLFPIPASSCPMIHLCIIISRLNLTSAPCQEQVTNPKVLSLMFMDSSYESQGPTSDLSNASHIHNGH